MCGQRTEGHKILGKRLNKSQGKNPRNKIGITITVSKCNQCGLIYSNPQPIPFDLQDHYGIALQNYWVEQDLTISEGYFKGEIERLRQLIGFTSGMKSLVIGAGFGRQMKALSNIGFDTYGFEPSKSFYDKAISKMKINPEKLKLGTIEEVKYQENYFDFITFSNVLEHVYNPSESIKKAIKWLKPNGVIHIEVPSSAWLINKFNNVFYRLTLTDYISNISPMHAPFHLYEFSLKSFKLHAQQNAYVIAFHEYYVCKTFMPKIVDKILKPYMRLTNTGMDLCVWLRKK
jgi:2-polyprenyl-3-methyl-5-hydroxy-6-metoxy-1,4-benzoquinol methylase|tara:strand:+ start:929 stop:1792 length:864 start_codon:yes stop_codon:yes gene_type:complete